MIGCPNNKIWPDFFKSKSASKLLERVENQYNNISTISKNLSKSCIDLLNALLVWDPVYRISVKKNYINFILFNRQAKH